ncbi:cytochrome P450 [Cytidiella melzeri]|nr:cytochrome P450 [Cytidiella melzeri]
MAVMPNALLWLPLLYVVFKAVQFYRLLKSINFHPGSRWLISDVASAIPVILPWRIPYILPGKNRAARQKYADYAWFGCDVISDVAMFPLRALFVVADPDVIKEVAAARSRYPKPVELYRSLDMYGRNIVVSEGDEWKRFRKIANPSFSERNNRLVWEETQRIVLELFEQEWAGKDTVCDEDVLMTTVSIALFVISSAGFGQAISWRDEGLRTAGYEFSFKETMYHISNEIVTKAITPAWLLKLGLTAKMRTARVAYELMEKYMVEMVQKRRNAETKAKRHDLLSGLLDANEEEFNGYAKLTDREVISNIYIFLIAGHETTGHTLAFAFILLALYPEEQEKLYRHCKSKYENIASYTYAMGVLNETLRLYTPVSSVPKVAAEDSVLYATSASGQKVPVFVPKGSNILFHMPGLHHNPRYWEDPYAFKPSRFLEPDWPRDALVSFSGGARSCIGRRFSEVEAIAVITLFSLRYSIEVKEEPQFVSETFEERKARLLKHDALLTLTKSAIITACGHMKVISIADASKAWVY